MIYIASMFSKPFLVRTLAMRNSAIAYMPGIQFLFLHTDPESEKMIRALNYDDIRTFSIDDLHDNELIEAGKDKTNSEFAWMSKVVFMRYLLDQTWLQEKDIIVWIDSDILFFSSLMPVIEKMQENYSVGIQPHFFPKDKENLNTKIGRYNAGMFMFKADQYSKKIMTEWRAQCIDWCYLRYEDGKLGDQMYLNAWTTKYPGIIFEVPNRGVDVGPWRVNKQTVTEISKENFLIDGEPLVCFHFHGFKFYTENGKVKPIPITVQHKKIYTIYTREIEKAWKSVLSLDKNWYYEFSPKPNPLRLIKQKIHKFILG